MNKCDAMALVERYTLVLTVYLVFGLNYSSHSQNYSQTILIFKDKLDPAIYNTEVRPLLDQSKVIKVNVFFELLSIVEIDDVTQSFTVNGLLGSFWTDEVVVWNPAKYGGQKLIQPLPKHVWRPRVLHWNNLGPRDPFNDDKAPVFVESDGRTSWTPGSIFSSSCELDLTDYPFDTQTCDIQLIQAFRRNVRCFVVSFIQLVAMKYTEDELKFVARFPNVSQTYFTTHNEWMVEYTELTINSLISDDWKTSIILLKFYLRRRPSFLLLSIVLPVVFLSFLNILVVVIPVECGEKISYGITVLLALSVYMSIVSSMLPRSSLSLPNVTIYLFILLVMSMFTVIDSIIIVYIHNMVEKVDMKLKVQNQIRHALTKITTIQQEVSTMQILKDDNMDQLNKNASAFSGSNVSLKDDQTQSKAKHDCSKEDSPCINRYKLIGKHIDVVSFVVFFIFWLVTTLGFMLHMSLK